MVLMFSDRDNHLFFMDFPFRLSPHRFRGALFTLALQKRHLRFLFCLSVLGLGSSVAAESRVHFETTTLKDALGPGKTVYKFSFPFENKGSQPVEILDIQTSCGCTAAKLEKRVYQPGESGVIRGEYNAGDRQGKQLNTIKVRTDNAEQPEILLQLEIDVPQLLAVKPGLLLWRVGELAEAKRLTLVPNKEHGVKVLSVECDSGDFAVEWVRPEEEGAEIAVTVTPKSTNEAYRSILRIKVELPNDPEPRTFLARAMVR